jgi:hypothetical protein
MEPFVIATQEKVWVLVWIYRAVNPGRISCGSLFSKDVNINTIV